MLNSAVSTGRIFLRSHFEFKIMYFLSESVNALL
jgi:hypothetical protein